jgi:hypothetical protein
VLASVVFVFVLFGAFAFLKDESKDEELATAASLSTAGRKLPVLGPQPTPVSFEAQLRELVGGLHTALEQALGLCEGCVKDSNTFVRLMTAQLRECAPEVILPIGRAADDYMPSLHERYMGAYKQACELIESARVRLGQVADSPQWGQIAGEALELLSPVRPR